MATTIEEYLEPLPQRSRDRINQVRQLVKKLLPDAEESISYAIPAFKWKKKPLLYIGAYAKHLGCYPAPSEHPDFQEDFVPYKTSKGTVQFPLDQALPLALVRKIILHRKQLIEDELQKKK